MARKKQSITEYLEEKRIKRIDPSMRTMAPKAKAKIPKELECKEISMVTNPSLPMFVEKKGFFRRVYDWVFGWFLTKKSDAENIFQFAVRQFLPPDSGGKPSWQLFIVLWALVIMSFVTASEIQIALSWVMTYNDKGQVLTKKMHGFSEAFIYFIMIFGGVVSGLFYKREKNRKSAEGVTEGSPETPGVLESLKERVTSFISKK